MAAPLSQLVDDIGNRPKPSEIETDALTCLRDMLNIYKISSEALISISQKCHKHGLKKLLVAMPLKDGQPVVANNFQTTLSGLTQAWSQLSDKTMPTFPDDPDPIEPVPEGEQ